MKNPFLRFFIFILAAVSLLLLSSCAEIQLKAISSPPPTAKLRVYVEAISSPFPYPTGAGQWIASHKGFKARQIGGIEKFFRKTGIYEVVTEDDVNEVLGSRMPAYTEMKCNNWKLTKEIGKALYVEYVFVIERRAEPDKMAGVDQYFTVNLINAKTGKLYEASARLDTFDRASHERMGAIIKNLHRTVFLSAKNDMLETAMRKSEKMYTQDKTIAVAPKPEPKTAPPPPEIKPLAQPKIPDKPVAPPEPKPIAAVPKPEPKIAEPVKTPGTAQEKPRNEDVSGMNKLVIYDLEAPEQYRPVALILTEILREELFLLNMFIIVNRENLLDVNREMALQQSGLIDEKQAVKIGKGLAANQVVTGSLGILGKTCFLQTKRIDVETFATLGMASTRFAKGEEEDLLGRLPSLAKSLAGMR